MPRCSTEVWCPDLGRNLTNSQFPILIDYPRGSASADSKPCWPYRTRAHSQTRSARMRIQHWELRIGQISKSAILDNKLRCSRNELSPWGICVTQHSPNRQHLLQAISFAECPYSGHTMA